MKNIKVCVLDENKMCDDCGECNRCDLDPNKICDNCCKCIAIEDDGNEFRSRVLKRDGSVEVEGGIKPPKLSARRKESPKPKTPKEEFETVDLTGEPEELTPELVAYWEKILIEHGEAPADDGFGEIEVAPRNPVYGRRARKSRAPEED